MKIFILAGGVGTRLWPLSYSKHPKYLLKIEQNNSLLQQTFMRACLLTEPDNIFIITQNNVIEKIKNDIPLLKNENIVVEPCLGGTSNCLLLGILHCIRNKCNKNEVIVFMHADHIIKDEKEFIVSFKTAQKNALKSKKIVLIGVNPTFPSTEFGYIHYSGNKFISFTEKPNIENAKKFLHSGNYL
jgi:mannose-1-phosphate guanylyltransferase